MKKPTSVRLSPTTRQQIAELNGSISTVVEQAIADKHRRDTTGDLWVGTGLWAGWRLTTTHAASSYGHPVLVSPDGTAFGPGDLATSANRTEYP